MPVLLHRSHFHIYWSFYIKSGVSNDSKSRQIFFLFCLPWLHQQCLENLQHPLQFLAATAAFSMNISLVKTRKGFEVKVKGMLQLFMINKCCKVSPIRKREKAPKCELNMWCMGTQQKRPFDSHRPPTEDVNLALTLRIVNRIVNLEHYVTPIFDDKTAQNKAAWPNLNCHMEMNFLTSKLVTQPNINWNHRR